jgi:hypothetical protein
MEIPTSHESKDPMGKKRWENQAGWWFGTMDFFIFPFSWECHHPN